MQVSHPFRPSPRLPSARPRRAAHPLPRCARSRHGRRPPRSPPLRAAGAQPRAGHLHIHPGEANGPNSNTAPLPGGRRVHLGSACWGGAPVRNELPPLAPRGRRPGEWRQLIVSVPGRCGTVYMVPRAVFPILHCESSSGQPRGARTACVLLLAVGAEWAFFNSQPSILYKDTLGGDTRRMCDTSGWSWRWPSVVSRATRSAESRGEARRAATLESRRDGRGAQPTLMSSKVRCSFVL